MFLRILDLKVLIFVSVRIRTEKEPVKTFAFITNSMGFPSTICLEDIEVQRLNKKKEVVNSLNSSFGNLKSSEYDYKYDWDLKSIAYISDFDFKNGAVRVYCVNWSEVTENERSFADNLSVCSE